MLPAAGVSDTGFPPNTGRAVESEKAPGTIPCGLLKLEVAVEEHRLDACQNVVSAVQVTPAGLDHADPVVGEILDRFLQNVRIRDEICIEYEKVFTLGETGAVLKRTCLVAGAVGAVDMFRIKTLGNEAGNPFPADIHCIVGGIVEQLDL